MKINFLILLLTCGLSSDLAAQVSVGAKAIGGHKNVVSFTASLPLGVFQRSHWIGGSLDYTWVPGKLAHELTKHKQLGVLFEGGASYFLGKEQHFAGYPFRFGSYFDLHAMAGMLYHPSSDYYFTLLAGPAVSFYEKHSNTGLAASMSVNYFLNDRLSVGPGLQLRKDAHTDALWALTVRASYLF